MSIFKIELGEKVICKLSGFEGTVTARVEYVTGCIQYLVETKDGERWIDEIRLIEEEKKPKEDWIKVKNEKEYIKWTKRVGGSTITFVVEKLSGLWNVRKSAPMDNENIRDFKYKKDAIKLAKWCMEKYKTPEYIPSYGGFRSHPKSDFGDP